MHPHLAWLLRLGIFVLLPAALGCGAKTESGSSAANIRDASGGASAALGTSDRGATDATAPHRRLLATGQMNPVGVTADLNNVY
jgi:hypothetical protein